MRFIKFKKILQTQNPMHRVECKSSVGAQMKANGEQLTVASTFPPPYYVGWPGTFRFLVILQMEGKVEGDGERGGEVGGGVALFHNFT